MLESTLVNIDEAGFVCEWRLGDEGVSGLRWNDVEQVVVLSHHLVVFLVQERDSSVGAVNRFDEVLEVVVDVL